MTPHDLDGRMGDPPADAARGPPDPERSLMAELRNAVASAPRPVREIEVGIALSIALGRQRPASSCGGCELPLAFEGIPARTVVGLEVPFRLVLARAEGS
jgi:hypothetical protein